MVFSWFFYAICHFHDIDYHFYDFSKEISGVLYEKRKIFRQTKTAHSSLAFLPPVKPKAEMQGCCGRPETHSKYLNQTLVRKL